MSVFKALVLLLAACGMAGGQDLAFRGSVEVIHRSKHKAGSSEVVIWLMPAHAVGATRTIPTRLVQKDKRFFPHVVAVSVGSEIEFPNRDPFFHDVFSIYRGKPFDLGLYESGSSRKVKFSQPGVSYIFCNIHPEMSAAVVAVPTPYFAVTGNDGSFQIDGVTPGTYRLELWYEFASQSDLDSLARDMEVNGQSAPVKITLHSSDIPAQHLNKYGQEYSKDNPQSY
jgi:plastocyanin